MFLKIYTVWLGVFSISFLFLPMYLVLNWRKRGTADGFSSILLVTPMIVQSFWLRHGWMNGDHSNIIINSFNLVVISFYICAYAYYQPKRKYLIGQLLAAAIVIKLAFFYVDSHEADRASEAMGSVAAGAQILGFGARINELIRAVRLGTTEYIPAVMQFAVFTLMAQWFLFGVLTANKFIMIANTAGLMISAATFFLYFRFPPLTWTVPIFNIPPQNVKKE